jgi:hypothetical protein
MLWCAPTLTMANLVHRTIIIDMNVQPLRVVVHSLHAIGLEHAVLLGEIGLCKRLLSTSHQRSLLFHN